MKSSAHRISRSEYYDTSIVPLQDRIFYERTDIHATAGSSEVVPYLWDWYDINIKSVELLDES